LGGALRVSEEPPRAAFLAGVERISTPTAVAAARGTILWVFTDGQQSMMAVEPEIGFTEGSSQGVWRQ
jgi:hypothetical protein